MSDNKLPTPAYDALPKHLRLFTQGLAAGMTNAEAARHAGSQGNPNSLKTIGSRYAKKPEVQTALAELYAARSEDDEDGVWQEVRTALLELVRDKSHPAARARACELMARITGRVGPNRGAGKSSAQAQAEARAKLRPPETPEEIRRVLKRIILAQPLEQQDLLLDEIRAHHEFFDNCMPTEEETRAARDEAAEAGEQI